MTLVNSALSGEQCVRAQCIHVKGPWYISTMVGTAKRGNTEPYQNSITNQAKVHECIVIKARGG